MKLTDTQRVILSQASQHPDGLAYPPQRLPAAARQTVAKALLKNDLVIGVHRPAYDAVAKWTVDGDETLLKITDQGLRAIGVSPEGDGEVAEPATVGDTALTGGEATPPQDTPAANAEAALYPALRADAALLDQARAAPTPTLHATLRDAAQRVIDAWDDESNQRYDLTDAMDALRQLLAKPARATREPGAPRKPREGTKQEQVLALLRREEGATIAQICEATGWQQHTVRGFFAGLKKRQGISVVAAERIRQIGPNKEGARGSYSIYRIAD